ncbi:MAG: DUF1365 domain-containing protein [Spongiibacteraceae bacterium]
MKSAIYTGWVRHRRYVPKNHRLRYKVFMMLLDLAELDHVFSGTRWWSVKRWAPARFKRSDFLGDATQPLDIAVRRLVEDRTGICPCGPIRLLTNLRYFGFIINPISCYYCFDLHEKLQFIVAEVNNTPWDERHCYVLSCEPDSLYQRISFNKVMHVSPFNPMDVHYCWRSNLPERTLRIDMQNWRGGAVSPLLEFDASLLLKREEITPAALRRILWQYPLMTLKVVFSIYWQALRLLIKGVPVYDHPGKQFAKNNADKNI